jgi:hypothetical protein
VNNEGVTLDNIANIHTEHDFLVENMANLDDKYKSMPFIIKRFGSRYYIVRRYGVGVNDHHYLHKNCTVHEYCGHMGWYDKREDAEKVLILYRKGYRDVDIKLFGNIQEEFLTEEDMEI